MVRACSNTALLTCAGLCATLLPHVGTAKFLAARHEWQVEGFSASLASVLRELDGNVAWRRRDRVQRKVSTTLAALPKDSEARIDTVAVRHAVRSYFAKEHGWQISGLLAFGSSAEADAGVLSLKAPQVARALAQGKGLFADEVIMLIVAIEGMITGEITKFLGHAYEIVGINVTEPLPAEDMLLVLTIYMHFVRYGDSDLDLHNLAMHDNVTVATSWEAADALLNFEYAARHSSNPFLERHYSFQDASDIAVDLTHSYGQLQNEDCVMMKEHLMSLDSRDSGRVPLDVFHAASGEGGSHYDFSESADYLEQIGALEAAKDKVPSVRISNYILGPGNCVGRSEYYSVCCLNECEDITHEIEGHVKAPMASAEFLLSVVNDVSFALDLPGRTSNALAAKLRAVGDLNGGSVPIHGRLFAQWLHFRFPNECPFPVRVKDEWYAQQATTASEEEICASIESANVTDWSHAPSALEQWSDEEELFVYATDATEGAWFPSLAHSLRSLMQPVLVICTLGASLRAAVTSLRHGSRGDEKAKGGFSDHYV